MALLENLLNDILCPASIAYFTPMILILLAIGTMCFTAAVWFPHFAVIQFIGIKYSLRVCTFITANIAFAAVTRVSFLKDLFNYIFIPTKTTISTEIAIILQTQRGMFPSIAIQLPFLAILQRIDIV